MKRVFLIVLDSFGIGAQPDADRYRDAGSNTLGAVRKSPFFSAPNLQKLGLFHLDGVAPAEGQQPEFSGCIARMQELSSGKDTITGHWEIGGILSEKAMPTYPQGFPEEFCREFSRRIGRGLLCNLPYSGTQVLVDYGEQHLQSGDLILYTSADSVCQLAAHEDIVPVKQLYEYCEIARGMLEVGRVIARPFRGTAPHFERTPERRDFSLEPSGTTILDVLAQNGLETISVGKIRDIFAGRSISRAVHTEDNTDSMVQTAAIAGERFEGFCFVNLVDFDMKYGHRNDAAGYAKAISEFDRWLGGFLPLLQEEDLLIITADHGCDPSYPGTDHTREYTPMLAWSPSIRGGNNLGTRKGFLDIGKTVLEAFGLNNNLPGTSFWPQLFSI